jgi:nitrous oxidase accessory protein NosD
MWKNRMYLQEHPKGNYETYGVQFNYASKGSIVSKNIIHGANVGIYLKETHSVSLYSNEVKWTKKFGCYCFKSNLTEFTGNLFMSNDNCGIMLDYCSNVRSWRNAALWNGSKDVWLVQSRSVEGLNSFISNSFVTTDRSQTGVKYVQGDINFDGKLSIHDMQQLSKYLPNPDNVLRSEFYMGDINVDGKLTSDDVNIMTRRILG